VILADVCGTRRGLGSDFAPDAAAAGFDDVETGGGDVLVHPRDPYHRIDTYSTSRRISVSVNGMLVAESTRAEALFETSLPTRYYLPVDDVRMELLEPSETITQCAYKGTARHWSARIDDDLVPDVAWTYDDVRREGEPVQGLIAFYNERLDLDVDGIRQERPHTRWSREAQR